MKWSCDQQLPLNVHRIQKEFLGKYGTTALQNVSKSYVDHCSGTKVTRQAYQTMSFFLLPSTQVFLPRLRKCDTECYLKLQFLIKEFYLYHFCKDCKNNR